MATMAKDFIGQAIDKISWKTIHEYYVQSGVKWRFAIEGGHEHRTPSIEEMQADLRNAINFVFSRNMATMDYGSWLIFWADASTAAQLGLPGAQLEVIFALTGSLINDTDDFKTEDMSLVSLKSNLEEAIHEENFELAARIKDQIDRMENEKA